MVLLERRSRALMATIVHDKNARRPAPDQQHPDGLTNREVEVLALIARGKTNKQIADLLFISSKTVGNHVQKILAKTAAANRAEAAAYAVKHAIE